MDAKVIKSLVLILCLFTSAQNSAQTVGLLDNKPGSFSGYTLFSKQGKTYLIDRGGLVVHSWKTENKNSHPGFLQSNGDLIAFYKGVKRFNWEGELLWEYKNRDANHDIAVLPNGHVLLMVKSHKSMAEAIQAGRNPEQVIKSLSPLKIIEINDKGDVVWDWHLWDHLIQDINPTMDNYGIIKEHPELADINYVHRKKPNWIHPNAIDYNEKLDQIIITALFFNEVWIIDHSTSIKESASHSGGRSGKGGDLLYRWGNPASYDSGTGSDQKLFGMHGGHWIADDLNGAGNVLVFNNGGERFGQVGNYSTVVEFTPNLLGSQYPLKPGQPFLPQGIIWSYHATPKDGFYAAHVSGAQRLENGNTFVVDGMKGLMFEVTHAGKVVWSYQNPVTKTSVIKQGNNPPGAKQEALFMAKKYTASHPGLMGRHLAPKGPVELYVVYATLSIQSKAKDRIVYPGEGDFKVGVGQLIPLVADETNHSSFIKWTIISGTASIKDVNNPHTVVTIQSENVKVEAIYH